MNAYFVICDLRRIRGAQYPSHLCLAPTSKIWSSFIMSYTKTWILSSFWIPLPLAHDERKTNNLANKISMSHFQRHYPHTWWPDCIGRPYCQYLLSYLKTFMSHIWQWHCHQIESAREAADNPTVCWHQCPAMDLVRVLHILFKDTIQIKHVIYAVAAIQVKCALLCCSSVG